jgi:hypothetical protein
MTIGTGGMGQKYLQKVSPKKGLMQHFNIHCVLVLAGGNSIIGNRTEPYQNRSVLSGIF